MARRAAFILAELYGIANNDPAQAWPVLAIARSRGLSRFPAVVWARGVDQVGHRVMLLAAALVLLKPACRAGLALRNPASYLAAMLKRGATAREIAASLAAALDARDGRLTWGPLGPSYRPPSYRPESSYTPGHQPERERDIRPEPVFDGWRGALAAIVPAHARAVAAWFAQCEQRGERTLAVSSRFHADYVRQHYGQALARVFGGPVEIIVDRQLKAIIGQSPPQTIDLPNSESAKE